MDFIDTHCHIQSAGDPKGERLTREVWSKDASLTGAGIVADAQKDGVTTLLCVGCDLEDSKLAVDFVQPHNGCYASIGIHPHEAKDYADHPEKLDEFAALAIRDKVVAVGECGLDYYYGHSPEADQATVLRFQIELALKHDLPLIFHVRDAFDDFWPIFSEYQGVRGVLHSYTDNAANLAKAMDKGLYIGVNGIATFAKDSKQLEVYRSIPLERMVLETDAPFLTPTPYRGSINQSKYVRRIAEFLAELRGEELARVAMITTKNAQTLFKI